MGAKYLIKTCFWFASIYACYNVVLGLVYMIVNLSYNKSFGILAS